MKTQYRQFSAAVLCAVFMAAPAVAQTKAYPSKPITLVVGFTPGGISDVLSRALAARLTAQMGQTVVVENKAGAATVIASGYVANAAPDGYTLFFQDMTSHAINAAAYKNLKYDSWNDFSMVSLVASTPLMLISSLASGAKDVKGLTALAKAKPQQTAYASSGNGTITHLAGESYGHLIGTKTLHAPYKGSSPATTAVISGEVAYTFSTMPPAINQMKAGKVYGLAVTSSKRVSAAPDVPTMKEAGVPIWTGSAYRWYTSMKELMATDVGEIRGAISYGPAHLEKSHPDFYWYGIHPTEALYTALGKGCESVTRTKTEDTDVVVGQWSGGRTGTLIGLRTKALPHKVTLFGSKTFAEQKSGGDDYAPLVGEIIKFLQTGKPPVDMEETLEMHAFMSAADESARRGGAPVKLNEVK